MVPRWFCALLLALPGAAGDCSQPPRFNYAEPIAAVQPSYPAGAVVRYRCRPGYVRSGAESPDVTCLADSTWSRKAAFCTGKSCGPPTIENGNFNTKTDLLFGATVTFSCNPGYRLVGPPSAQCVVRNGEVSWDALPTCEIVLCPPPPTIENGQLLSEAKEFTFGMAASYSCNEHFSLIGEATIFCTIGHGSQGAWSSPAPECKKVKCENPQVTNGRKLSGFGTVYSYGDTVSFECDPGYTMNGKSIVTCDADSTWTPPPPTCDRILCDQPPQLPFASPTTVVGDSSAVGTRVTYQCYPGFEAAPGRSPVVTCQSDGTWSTEDPQLCVRQQCSAPRVEHGNVVGNPRTFPYGAVVKFTCNHSYKLKQSSATCVVAGNGVDWNPAPPYCESGANMIIVGIFPLLLAMLVMDI